MKYVYIVLIALGSVSIISFTKVFDNNDFPKNENIEAAAHEPVVVLELFTSQGCSSCPSADLLLQKVKKEYKEEVFALSYHVDYWNYIGWKDPFSNAEYGKKQREYNIKFRNRSNYTPQLVINGKEHYVGSNSSEMYRKINEYKKKKSINAIDLYSVKIEKNLIFFKYDIQGGIENKILRIALVLDERITEVKRGENKNRTLQNSNIVVEEKSFLIEEISGTMKISVPEIVKENDKLNLIVLVETTDYDITAATKLSLLR